MKAITTTLLAIALPLMPMSSAHSQEARQSFGFNVASINGFPFGAVFLTGGGGYDPKTGFLKTGGGFRCLADINQGPLNGCKAGQGVRWDAVALLPSTTFKCTGAAGEVLKTAVTDGDTVVMVADFYRQGMGQRSRSLRGCSLRRPIRLLISLAFRPCGYKALAAAMPLRTSTSSEIQTLA
jgi:hypothetical protein